MFTSFTTVKLGGFTAVVVQQRQTNVQKKSVMHVQSCCFASLNLLLLVVLVAIAVVVAKAPYQVFRLPSSVFRLRSSFFVLRLRSSVFSGSSFLKKRKNEQTKTAFNIWLFKDYDNYNNNAISYLQLKLSKTRINNSLH